MGVLVETMALVWSTSTEMRLFLTTGILGAFTTFSTFSLDFAVLYERRAFLLCALYTVASFALSVSALFAGLHLVRRLVPHFDVVCENFRAGALAKRGLGYADLAALRPGLVYASISGFGQDPASPYVGWPAYAPIGDRSPIDVTETIAALRDVGYEGWFSIHQPLQPGQSVADAIREAHEAVGSLIA